jgi:phosphohistidine phosphatase
MRLLVVRHGPAEPRDPRRWPDDDHRPLSREGRRESRAALDGLAALERNVRVVLTSSATRAKSTAEILRDRLELTSKPIVWPELGPGAPAAPVLARLAKQVAPRATVAIVGHEPQLGELVGLGLTGEAVSVTRLGKAGVAALEFAERVGPDAAVLDWRLDRKALARLAKRR